MLDNTLVCDSAAHLSELEKAFGVFNRLSNELQSSYQTLQQRVAALTGELEEARRATEVAAAEVAAHGTTVALAVGDAAGRHRRRRRCRTNPRAQPHRSGDSRRRAGRRVLATSREGRAQEPELGRRRLADARRPPNRARGELVAAGKPEDHSADRRDRDARLQELAARNQRLSAIGKMAASLAHQIRTPLAGALLYLSQCRSRRDDRERSKLLEKGIERLRHLDLLVQDMLVFARGKGPGERVRVADLFKAVHDAAMAVKPANAHLVIHGSDVLVELDGNSTALTAALTNLVNNAFESAPDVVVTLKAKLRGDRVEFTVRDNGPGIAPSIQSRVFEPFFSTRPAGTGLGLAVVKTVAEAHGGDLALHSEGGRGTRIDLNLPRTAPVDLPPPAGPAAREVA